MRNLKQGSVLAVRAIGGLHVVTLAWDFVKGKEAKRDGLLGFAIERSELEKGKVIEQPQKSRAGIRHNKFIVLVRKDKPIAVWTGSTNISAGGIFGHSNVGHAIWDDDIAQRYLDYWERLADPKVTAKPLKEA